MKKYAMLLLIGVVFAFSEEIQEEKQEIKHEEVKKEEVKKKPTWRENIQPPEVYGNSYGVFRIGYAYQYQNAGTITRDNTTKFEYSGHFNDLYFGIERGWIGGKNKMFMASGYLDGAVGQTYFLSFGAKASLYLLKGWLIPYVGVGYQLEHLGFAKDDTQYNMHTAVVSAGTHINIAKGFGIDLQVRSGAPFYILKPKDAQTFGHPSINHVGFMVSFSFYDFNL
ncbi:hypothetical protein CQA57_07420 [Helicobacter anseris]|uniref:Outer membrane protein n=1 Tax=Helicobacter anseris TaxID=375926 RepID=A0A3D8J2Z7_9HELI|nr:hypothetical protein [Helicobacter anseris]RDU71912.1 hypothetical protein CQA57_07420 [Helicobacter anseris]